jgi:hypothetical protein
MSVTKLASFDLVFPDAAPEAPAQDEGVPGAGEPTVEVTTRSAGEQAAADSITAGQADDDGGEPAAPVDPLLVEARRTLSTRDAEAALTKAMASLEAAELEKPLGDPEVDRLRLEVLGSTFDLNLARTTAEGVEALEARQEELAFQAEEKLLAEKQLGKDTPIHLNRARNERAALEIEAAALKSMAADLKTINQLNAQAEAKALGDVVEAYRLADDTKVKELTAAKAEQWEIDMATVQSKIPAQGRPTYKGDLAKAVEARKASNLEVMRADWIQKQLTGRKAVTPPSELT